MSGRDALLILFMLVCLIMNVVGIVAGLASGSPLVIVNAIGIVASCYVIWLCLT